MKLFVTLLAVSLASNAASQCLKGWDVTLALKVTKLNQALSANQQHFGKINIPEVNQPGTVEMDQNAGWGKKSSINLGGFRIRSLKLDAVPNNIHEALLSVGFSAGRVRIKTELIKADGSPLGPDPSSQDYPVGNVPVKFRVRVTAYQINVGNNGGTRVSVALEMANSDAVVGDLDWKVPQKDVTAVRGALTEMMKRALKQGEEINLAKFDLPSGFDQNLMPKKIRFVTLYAANGQSMFGALLTTGSQPNEGGLNWNIYELLPSGRDATLKISGNKFMQMMKPSIAKALDIPSSKLSIQGGCPKIIALNQHIGGWKGATLQQATLQLRDGTNRVKVHIKLWSKVSSGITADVYIDLELSIKYNSHSQKFEIAIASKNHRTKYHRKWWVVLLEVVSLGFGRLVTEIITNVADGVIKNVVRTSIKIGPGTGTEIVNIGGLGQEVFKNLQVSGVSFSGGNFQMTFSFLNRK